MKENNIKEGWFRDDDESITIHHHSKQTAKSEAEEQSKWSQFISSTKKIVNSLKQDASDWYNKSAKEEKANKPADDTASKDASATDKKPAKDAAKKPVDSKKVDDFKKPTKMAADSDKPVYHFEQNDADWDEDDYDAWNKAGKGMKDDTDLENWGDNAIADHMSGEKDAELEEDYSDFSDFESLDDLEELLGNFDELTLEDLDMVDFELMQLYAEIDDMNQVINTVY